MKITEQLVENFYAVIVMPNMESQTEKIAELLVDGDWHCVNEMLELYCVDYRRRLCDLKEIGYLLENQKCELHNFHRGGSKMWRMVDSPQPFERINEEKKPEREPEQAMLI